MPPCLAAFLCLSWCLSELWWVYLIITSIHDIFLYFSQAMQRGVMEENLRLHEKIEELQVKYNEVESRWGTFFVNLPTLFLFLFFILFYIIILNSHLGSFFFFLPLYFSFLFPLIRLSLIMSSKCFILLSYNLWHLYLDLRLSKVWWSSKTQ